MSTIAPPQARTSVPSALISCVVANCRSTEEWLARKASGDDAAFEKGWWAIGRGCEHDEHGRPLCVPTDPRVVTPFSAASAEGLPIRGSVSDLGGVADR